MLLFALLLQLGWAVAHVVLLYHHDEAHHHGAAPVAGMQPHLDAQHETRDHGHLDE